MPNVDVKQLLNPTGAEIQNAVQGTRNAGRVAVAVYWEEIETALMSGVPVAAIYRVLRKAGLVSVTRQAFTRQVKARREGFRDSGKAGGRYPSFACAVVRGGFIDGRSVFVGEAG